jgi:diaminohydroxyphosphoribosylaminopyrimidine deaminase/5-amino-6-(5-phosphoribosylamino)uracil reductase
MVEIKIGQKLTDQEAMALAMSVARKGLGWVSPNPAVGCTILDNNNCLLSFGYHEKHGGPHAEINALKGLTAESLVGARVFVTLEPCAHHGKTPPCAEALAKLPLKEVVFGLHDPNPLVQGKGAKIIRDAGITATHYNREQGALENACEHFLKNMRAQLPFVSIKVAASLDGKIALKNGQSQWITGPEAREETHFLRASHDALLVGVSTFLIDNPSLNIRHKEFPSKPNSAVVLDPNGRGIDRISGSKLLASHRPEEIFWVVESSVNTQKLDDQGVNVIKASTLSSTNTLSLAEVKVHLWKHSIRSLLVEGGGATISAFINQKAADRIYLFQAPMIIGNTSGVSWASALTPIYSLQESVQLSPFEMSSFGKDLLLTARFL